nr:MAG TPA: hypothetical protein [Caudoviricetes sp.]
MGNEPQVTREAKHEPKQKAQLERTAFQLDPG